MTTTLTKITSTSPLLEMLQDPIDKELLLNDPVYLNCCGGRLNRAIAVKKFGEKSENQCSIVDETCVLCGRGVTGFFKDQRLKQVMQIICGLINDFPFIVIKDFFECNHLFCSETLSPSSTIVKDVFWEILNSLLNDKKAVNSLKTNSVFQERLAASCHVLTMARLRDSVLNYNNSYFTLPQGLTILNEVPTKLIEMNQCDHRKTLSAILNHIFQLDGKAAIIDDNSASEFSIEIIPGKWATSIVSIFSDQETQFALEDCDISINLDHLIERMIIERHPQFTMKPGHSLFLLDVNPEICDKVAKEIYESRSSEAMLFFLRGSLKTHPALWRISFSWEHLKDLNQVRISCIENIPVSFSVQSCVTRIFTAGSFAQFIKRKGNVISLPGTRRLIFKVKKPKMFIKDKSTEESTYSFFKYMASLAGKRFSTCSFHYAHINIDKDSVELLFEDVTFYFENELIITNFKEFFAMMEAEKIQKVEVTAGVKLVVLDKKLISKLNQNNLTSDEVKNYLKKSLSSRGLISFNGVVQGGYDDNHQCIILFSDNDLSLELASSASSSHDTSNSSSSEDPDSIPTSLTSY